MAPPRCSGIRRPWVPSRIGTTGMTPLTPRQVACSEGAAREGLTVRSARAGEAEFLTDLSLRAKAFWGYDAAFLARCRAVMTIKAANIEHLPHYLAVLDGRIAGFYGFEPDTEGIGLDYLFVEPD